MESLSFAFSSSSSSSLPFAALASNSWSSVRIFLARIETEMPLSFSISGTPKKENISASWGYLGQLIESQAFALGLMDSGSGGVGEFKGTDPEAGRELEKSVIIGDGAYNSNNPGSKPVRFGSGFLIFCSFEEPSDSIDNLTNAGYFSLLLISSKEPIFPQNPGNAGDRNRITIKSRLIESFMDRSVEFGIGSSCQE